MLVFCINKVFYVIIHMKFYIQFLPNTQLHDIFLVIHILQDNQLRYKSGKTTVKKKVNTSNQS